MNNSGLLLNLICQQIMLTQKLCHIFRCSKIYQPELSPLNLDGCHILKTYYAEGQQESFQFYNIFLINCIRKYFLHYLNRYVLLNRVNTVIAIVTTTSL